MNWDKWFLGLDRLREGGKGGDRGGDGWMASSTQWTWVWVNSGRWWRTGKPDVLQSMGSQRVGHDWATELNWFNLQLVKYCSNHVTASYVTVGESDTRQDQALCWGLTEDRLRAWAQVWAASLCGPRSVLSGRSRHASSWRRGLRDGTNGNPQH